jgi:hypothetical protein
MHNFRTFVSYILLVLLILRRCGVWGNISVWKSVLQVKILKSTALRFTSVFFLHRHIVTFQIVTAASMKMAAFWDKPSYSLVELGRCLRGAYCLHHHRPDDGGSKHLWNVGLLLRDYTAQYLKMLSYLIFCSRQETFLLDIKATVCLQTKVSADAMSLFSSANTEIVQNCNFFTKN